VILLVLWLGSNYGINGLGVGALIYMGQLYALDRALARREMKRFDAMPGGYRGPTEW
jgi:hypothetical protein